ncbi:hypothetical protein R1flu_001569 [Riccia fluitans]|uniref:Uncharacterized protein n=1 Tax=Riccia fluitans TaxID=41844 RepID=A0ABD1Y7L9_9MARC
MDIYLIAENLVYSLVELENVGELCPVVLVGHCAGGLVVQEEFRSREQSCASAGYSLVVEEGSGRKDVDKFATISGVDHLSICHPKDQQSDNFLFLVHFLEEIPKKRKWKTGRSGRGSAMVNVKKKESARNCG